MAFAANWVEAVAQHPSVQIQYSAIAQQRWKTLELEAKQGFDFNITSSGHLTLVENYDSNFSRASKQDPYLDMVFSASKTIYDFGQNQALINAQKALRDKAALNFATSFEDQTHKLFSLIVQYQKAQRTKDVINATRAEIDLVLKTLASRFEAGLGTMTDIRRTQLKQIDFETQAVHLQYKINEVEHVVKSEYGIPLVQLEQTWQTIKAHLVLPASINQNNLRSNAMSDDEQYALRQQRSSIAAQKKPHLALDINATMFDVTRNLKNYRMAGELRLTFPAFDSGYRSARMTTLTHAITAEQQSLDQLIQQKTLALKANQRLLEETQLHRQQNTKQLSNLQVQLGNMKHALGQTSNDYAGLTSLYTQIASHQIALVHIDSRIDQLMLDSLLLSEQIIHQFKVAINQLL